MFSRKTVGESDFATPWNAGRDLDKYISESGILGTARCRRMEIWRQKFRHGNAPCPKEHESKGNILKKKERQRDQINHDVFQQPVFCSPCFSRPIGFFALFQKIR